MENKFQVNGDNWIINNIEIKVYLGNKTSPSLPPSKPKFDLQKFWETYKQLILWLWRLFLIAFGISSG